MPRRRSPCAAGHHRVCLATEIIPLRPPTRYLRAMIAPRARASMTALLIVACLCVLPADHARCASARSRRRHDAAHHGPAPSNVSRTRRRRTDAALPPRYTSSSPSLVTRVILEFSPRTPRTGGAASATGYDDGGGAIVLDRVPSAPPCPTMILRHARWPSAICHRGQAPFGWRVFFPAQELLPIRLTIWTWNKLADLLGTAARARPSRSEHAARRCTAGPRAKCDPLRRRAARRSRSAPLELSRMLSASPAPRLLDVREPSETASGVILGRANSSRCGRSWNASANCAKTLDHLVSLRRPARQQQGEHRAASARPRDRGSGEPRGRHHRMARDSGSRRSASAQRRLAVGPAMLPMGVASRAAVAKRHSSHSLRLTLAEVRQFVTGTIGLAHCNRYSRL